MDLDALERLVRIRVSDHVEPVYFCSDDVQTAILNAMVEAAERSWCLPFNYTQQTTDGIARYLLKVDAILVDRVFMPDFDRRLKRVDREWLDSRFPNWQDDTSVTPEFYIQEPAHIVFALTPVADAAIDNTPPAIELRGYKRPQTVNDLWEFPEYLHKDLAYWAAYELMIRPDNDRYFPEAAANNLAQFERRFGGKRSANALRISRLRDPGLLSGRRIA